MMWSHLIISIALRIGSMNTIQWDILPFLILAVGLCIVIFIITKRLGKGNVKGMPTTDAVAPTQNVYRQNEPASYVKRCPTCKSIFTDETLAFCLSDGSTLERVPDTFTSNDPNATLAYPEARDTIPPTVQYRPDMFPNKKD